MVGRRLYDGAPAANPASPLSRLRERVGFAHSDFAKASLTRPLRGRPLPQAGEVEFVGAQSMTNVNARRDGDHAEIRASVRALCAEFPGEYWRGLDRERTYPSEFVAALTKAGFLAALIP